LDRHYRRSHFDEVLPVRFLALGLSLAMLPALALAQITQSSHGGSFTSVGSNPTMPRANLIAEYLMDAGAGPYSLNAAYPQQPDYNLIGPSEQYFNDTTYWTRFNTTLTDFYAPNPNTDFVASRAQLGGGTAFLFVPTFPLLTQQYTLSIYAESNTGTQQKFRMAYDLTSDSGASPTYSPDLVVPATGWVRLSYTFTPPSADSYSVIVLAEDVAGDTADLSIWGAQLEFGPHMTTYIPHFYHMVLGGAPQHTANAPSWVTGGLDFTANSGLSVASAFGWAPLEFTNASVYVACKWTGSEVVSGSAAMFADGVSAPIAAFLVMGDSSFYHAFSEPVFAYGGQAAIASDWNLHDGAWHTLTGTYDGTNVSLYIDGALAIQRSSVSVGRQSLIQLVLGEVFGTNNWPGIIGYASLYSQAHTLAQVAQNTTTLRGILSNRGITISAPSRFALYEGDSISAGVTHGGETSAELTDNTKYPWLVNQGYSPILQGTNFAVSGNKLSDVVGRQALTASVLNSLPPGTTRLLSIFAGTNDAILNSETPASFASQLASYISYEKANVPGLKVVVCTLTSSGQGSANSWRDTANPLIRAGVGQDATADLAANSNLGCDSCYTNSTYFEADGLLVHLTPAAHAIAASIVAAAFHSVGM
jgi:hypothetical protein